MAIIFPRPLPAVIGIESSRFGLEFNTTLFESPVNRVAQVLKRPGNLWAGQYKYPPMIGAAAREWKAWLVSMEGPAGSFLAFDPDHRMPDGSATSGTSSPLVMGASQSGSSLVTDGWLVSTTGLLVPGDYIQIGGTGTARQLKIVTEQVDSDVTGQATINFKPALHKPPLDNAPIIFENPVGVFRFEDNSAAAWEADRAGSHGFAFSFIEVPEVS